MIYNYYINNYVDNNMKNKNCNVCGKEFTPISSKSKFCSKECRFYSEDLKKTSNGCLEWSSALSGGYGIFVYKKERYTAHRLSCEIAHGPEPEGKPFVLHSCNNRKCINSDHLRWGTREENANDMAKSGVQKGSNNPGSKLSEAEVIYIKNNTTNTRKELSEIFNVSIGCIGRIITGERWPHLR